MIKIDLKGIKKMQEDLRKIELTVPLEMRSKFKQAADIMKKDIVDTIERGNSPVKGNKRFKEYSDTYTQQIFGQKTWRTINGKKVALPPTGADLKKFQGKRIRPVNMKLSGRMLKSIAARFSMRGFTIYFTSKLAKIHSTEGAAGKRAAIRKVQPYGSEKWKPSVITGAKRFLERETLKKVVLKLRRL
jgi:hypothetical protein